MASVAVAHLLHRKLRTTLCVLAVGIGIAMLIVMLGLSHGMLNEVADRMQSVDAELIVLPQQENVIYTAGAAFPAGVPRAIDGFEFEGRPAVAKTIPVFVDTLPMARQQQRVFGVDRADMASFLGSRKVVEGRLFDDGRRFGDHVDSLRNANGVYDPTRLSEPDVLAACEMVIDTRLARVGGYRVGDRVTYLGRSFEIVGVVESGVAGRVFCPIQVLQCIKNGGLPWSSFIFVKLRPPPAEAGADYEERAADALGQEIKQKVELKSAYRQLMYESFSQIYLYINIASGVALVVCFLFIMVTMYMMVLERTREIGVLKSLGAGRAYLVREAVTEAVLVCVTGTAVGILLAFVAKYTIEGLRPLLTMTIEPRFVALAVVIGIVGGGCSALYPGYRAARLDPAAALSFD